MNFTLKNKKIDEVVNLPVHSQMWLCDEGMIVREDVCYEANILN
jgi:hypothetical protein